MNYKRIRMYLHSSYQNMKTLKACFVEIKTQYLKVIEKIIIKIIKIKLTNKNNFKNTNSEMFVDKHCTVVLSYYSL